MYIAAHKSSGLWEETMTPEIDERLATIERLLHMIHSQVVTDLTGNPSFKRILEYERQATYEIITAGIQVSALEANLAQREAALKNIRAFVDDQAEDENVWFRAVTLPEAYLQKELRSLHAVVEMNDCTNAAGLTDDLSRRAGTGAHDHD